MTVTFPGERRPLQAYTEALADAGFVIERLREPTNPDPAKPWRGGRLFLNILAELERRAALRVRATVAGHGEGPSGDERGNPTQPCCGPIHNQVVRPRLLTAPRAATWSSAQQARPGRSAGLGSEAVEDEGEQPVGLFVITGCPLCRQADRMDQPHEVGGVRVGPGGPALLRAAE